MSFNGNQKRLSSKQRKAIPALMTAPSILEAADLAGVSERTLHRWLDQPLFRSELYAAEGVLLDAATRRLIALADMALDVLESILDDPEAHTAQRRQAAEAVLSHLVKLRELRSFEERLSALEREAFRV